MSVSDQIHGPGILLDIPITDGFHFTFTETALSSFIVTGVLCVACVLLGRKLTKRPGKLQVITEKLVTMLYNMVENTMGKHNLKFAPYIGALFLSSIFGSLIGTTGFLKSTTTDLSTTMTWAVMTTIMVWAGNIKENGFFGWLKGFTEPIFVMTPMNVISEIASPISMGFRHFGNILGGGVLTTLLYYALSVLSRYVLGWIPNAFIANIPIFQVGIPAVFSLYFDFFSGFVQALVFSLLTMVYVGAANPPHTEESEMKKVSAKN